MDSAVVQILKYFLCFSSTVFSSYMTLSFRDMETLTFVVLDYSVIYSGK